MTNIRIITYSGRKLKYELIDLVGVLCLLSVIVIIIGQKTNNIYLESNSNLLYSIFSIGVLWFIIRLFIGDMEWYKPIKESGVIEFYDHYLVIKEKKIELARIKRIRVSATQCKGLPSGGKSGISDGTGNFIEIFLENKTKLKEKILIENVQQRNNLKELMDNWKLQGVTIIGDWKPFLHIFQK